MYHDNLLIMDCLLDEGKLQDAQKVLKDAIATIEQSLTAKDTFCQVSQIYILYVESTCILSLLLVHCFHLI